MNNSFKGGSRSPKRPHQNVRDTSKLNFAEYLASGKHHTRIAAVYNYLKTNGPSSRLMIAKGLGLWVNLVTSPCNSLINFWNAAEDLQEKQICKISGNRVYFIALNKDISESTKSE